MYKGQIALPLVVRSVWVVTASYAAGNKMIVFIDAVTGIQLQMTETEPTNFLEGGY